MKRGLVAFCGMAYRDENGIDRAVESVLNQTYKDIRLYIACGEATVERIRSYEKKDSRVRTCFFPEKERSTAFCSTLEIIKKDAPEYYANLDVDDWYQTDFCEKMVTFTQRYQTDITIGGYNEIGSDSKVVETHIPEEELVCGVQETQKYFLLYERYILTVWGKLYRMKLFENFEQSSRPLQEEYGSYGGDTLLNYCVFPNAKKIGFVRSAVYNYQRGDSSITRVVKAGRINAPAFLRRAAVDYLDKVGDMDHVNRYYLWLKYGEDVWVTLDMILKSRMQMNDKFEMVHALLSQEELYMLYELTFPVRADSLQEKYLRLLFESETKFAQDQLFKLILLLYPDIILTESETAYEAFDLISERKNACVAERKRSIGI